jgi:hypothetical protein
MTYQSQQMQRKSGLGQAALHFEFELIWVTPWINNILIIPAI